MDNQKKYQNSVLNKIRKAFFLLYIITLVVSLPAIYFITYNQVHSEANKELDLMVDMVKSIQNYIRQDVRDDLLKLELFHSPAISGSTTITKIARHLAELKPNYYLKLASDNPLNTKNQAVSIEKELLARYRNDSQLNSLIGTGTIQGRDYLLSTRPLKSATSCMLCHGDPNKAPSTITKEYGKTHGFGYKPNTIVGLNVAGVPLKDINALVLQRALIAIGIFTIIFTIIFLTINQLSKKIIIEPLAAITETAIAISQGELDKKINIGNDDSEIGALSQAFELMQRSLLYAIKRMDKNPDDNAQ
ncbi:MAG: hypothetical protein CSA09_04545 [Candidatus Contendobacter odensis]|uniref:histidine kinase n=1 Tax=Candidatus Contendibacter odensensis TaxID=1400860 RepID=A0A2G6PE52_9GAMM|nr:MAG: hypothetical protein CSA09_04545 [Candidatus Contendobacter odensis]